MYEREAPKPTMRDGGAEKVLTPKAEAPVPKPTWGGVEGVAKGDAPGHPFRGNQHEAQSAAARQYEAQGAANLAAHQNEAPSIPAEKLTQAARDAYAMWEDACDRHKALSVVGSRATSEERAATYAEKQRLRAVYVAIDDARVAAGQPE